MLGKTGWLLIVILLTGIFFRFYKLDWGEGFYFHSDEYHIAAAVDRLSFPSAMNPRLFSYGSFIVYLIYFTKPLFSSAFPFLAKTSNFIVGRFFSAVFSSLTILWVFLISARLFRSHSKGVGVFNLRGETASWPLLAAFLAAITPGLIQQAHFTTPESVLTFWLFLTLWFLILYVEKGKGVYFCLAAVSLGVGLGTKAVAATFLLPFLLSPFLVFLPNSETSGKDGNSETGNRNFKPKFPSVWCLNLATIVRKNARRLLRSSLTAISGLFAVALFFFLTFPYAFLDFRAFKSTWNYETALARGALPVFYTRQFVGTTPLLFQFERIFPLALGPALVVFGTFGFFLGLFLILRGLTLKRADPAGARLILVVTAFLSYLLPNAFLFAKWTRFMAPAFPFFAIFSAFFLLHLRGATGATELPRRGFAALLGFFVLVQLFWCLAFFSVYRRPDVRITADRWINENIPQGSSILVEGGNMVDLPLGGDYARESLDFYGLEDDFKARQRLFRELERADYFVVQSRRVFANHLRLPRRYPFLARFYSCLFYEKLGFKEVAEFASFPQIKVGGFKWELADELAEETWSVFDHPVVRVFRKVRPLTASDYRRVLEESLHL